MPYARIEIPAGWPAGKKRKILEATDASLVEVLGVPPRDAFLRLFEYGPENALVPGRHGPLFTYVEIQLFPGRRPGTKGKLYRSLVERFTALGIPSADLTVALVEIPQPDWGIAGGQPASQVMPGFAVEI